MIASMSLSNLALISFLAVSIQTFAADEAKPKKDIKFKQVSKAVSKPDEVRQLPVAQKACDVSGTFFAIRDQVDEAHCIEVAGKVTQSMDPNRKILQEMKSVPTLTPPKRDFPDPRRNYDPLKGTPSNP